MSRSIRARLRRLEHGPPTAERLGREVLALVDALRADGMDEAELHEIFDDVARRERERVWHPGE